MRIGFLISGDQETVSGGYIYDRQVAKHLRQKGQEIEWLYFPSHNYWDRFVQSPQLPSSQQFQNLSLDILLQDELDHPALIFLNQKLKTQVGVPIVSIVHHLRCCESRPSWSNRFYRSIETRYLTTVDGFIFNSRTTRQAVEELIGNSKKSVTAYPAGDRLSDTITESDIIARAKEPGPLRILFVGNLIRRKALHVLLSALTRLPQLSYLLTVIGDLTRDKSYVDSIRKQIQNDKLSDKVILRGAVTDAELVAEFKKNQVLSIPSDYEGYGIAYLEGMGFGLPAIGTQSGGASEIITHGQDGFLIPVGDSQTLARHLSELNNDRDKLISLSINALYRFKSQPTWQDTAQTILTFLQGL